MTSAERRALRSIKDDESRFRPLADRAVDVVSGRLPLDLPLATCHSALFLRNKLVTGGMHGPEMHGLGRVTFELLAKAGDMVVNGARGRVAVVAPDLIQ